MQIYISAKKQGLDNWWSLVFWVSSCSAVCVPWVDCLNSEGGTLAIFPKHAESVSGILGSNISSRVTTTSSLLKRSALPPDSENRCRQTLIFPQCGCGVQRELVKKGSSFTTEAIGRPVIVPSQSKRIPRLSVPCPSPDGRPRT